MENRTRSTIKMLSISAVLVLALGGCAMESYLVAKDDTSRIGDAATKIVQASAQTVKAPIVQESDGFYVSKRTIAMKQDADRLPEVFDQPLQLAYNPRASLRDVGAIIARTTGVPVVFSGDISSDASSPVLSNGFRHDGSLKQLLDHVSSVTNTWWRFDNREIVYYRYDTRVFHIAALPGSSEFSAGISNKSTSTGGSGGTTASISTATTGQTYEIKNKLEFWGGLKAEIQQMLSPSGRVSVSEALSTVTVTGTPQEIGTVSQYIAAINEKKSKQIMVSVQIYSVDTTTSDKYGVNWGAVYNNLSSKFKLSYGAPGVTDLSNLGNLTAVIDPNGNSPWATTQAVLAALSTQGATSLLSEVSAVTVSGESVPVNVTKEITYLASVNSNSVPNSGTSVSVTPGIVTAGLSVNTIPQVLMADKLLLQQTIDLSSIDGIDTQTTGTGANQQSIQTPRRSTRSLAGKVILRSGQTLVMSGFQQTDAGFTESGVGKADAGMISGGGKMGSASRRTLVVLVTPYIMSGISQ